MVKRITNIALVVLLGLSTGCGTTKPKPSAPPPASKTPDFSEVVPTKMPPSRTGNPESYVVFGKRYYVDKTSEGYRELGAASWYGPKFHGKKTSSGAIFDMYEITAAHKTLPIPSYARVTHLENGRSVVVKINDRGPFAHNRIIDLSYAAANKLGMTKSGTARVEVLALPPHQYLPGHGPREALLTQVNQGGRATPTGANVPHNASFARNGNGTPVYIQVGAFSNRDNAELLKNRLANHLKHPVRIEPNGNQWYKVRVGPLGDPAEAQQVAGQLTGLGVDSPHFIFD